MTNYIKAVIMTLVSLATFAANIPVIFVTFRSRRFENDSVAKLIASLAVSDFGNGLMAGCCAGMAWSGHPGEQTTAWLSKFVNSGMYTFGMCSIWHLAAVSVIKCAVIIRPLNHFTIFTDRVRRTIVFTIWTLSVLSGGANNLGVTESYFNQITFLPYMKRQNNVLWAVFASSINFIAPTVIIMIAYRKMFLAVRHQVRSMPTVVQGPLGVQSIFGSSVRSAKNLFVMCIAYWSTFMPVNFSVVLRATGMTLPDWVQFAASWIYVSSSAINGILYISLHSYVRRELRRYLPRCRRATVAVASTQPVGDVGGQRQGGTVDHIQMEHTR